MQDLVNHSNFSSLIHETEILLSGQNIIIDRTRFCRFSIWLWPRNVSWLAPTGGANGWKAKCIEFPLPNWNQVHCSQKLSLKIIGLSLRFKEKHWYLSSCWLSGACCGVYLLHQQGCKSQWTKISILNHNVSSPTWSSTCHCCVIKNILNVSRYHPNIEHFETIFWQVSIRTPKFFHHFFVFSDDFDDVILSFAGFILQHQRFGIHLPPGTGKECKARKTSRNVTKREGCAASTTLPRRQIPNHEGQCASRRISTEDLQLGAWRFYDEILTDLREAFPFHVLECRKLVEKSGGFHHVFKMLQIYPDTLEANTSFFRSTSNLMSFKP